MTIKWAELLTVDCNKFTELFVDHTPHIDHKICIRGHTIQFTGTQQKFTKLMDFLEEQMESYVFPEAERKASTWRKARDKFGNIAPDSDGKLGEMLLYIFVEAILGTPLMAYKLKDLGNPNDQVKGADGVFVGEYQGQQALLIGESKIHDTLGSAISSTFTSLTRFHDQANFHENELLLSRKYPRERAMSGDQLDAALRILDEEYEILVHPVFVSYSFDKVASVSADATTRQEAEIALAKHIDNEMESWKKKILKKKSKHPRPFQVYLDFFFLPVENSLQLREHFYELLHGHPYVPKTEDASKTKKVKSKGGKK
jgi:hypothetical protein